MPEKLENILECIEDIDFILNHNDFEITQTIKDKILKPAINMNIIRIAEQFKKLKDDYEIEILKNFKNEDLKSMSDIFGNYDLGDISVENIIKNHLPTIKATIEKIAVLRESFNDSQKVILDEFFEKELKDSKSIYSNEVVYDRKRDGE